MFWKLFWTVPWTSSVISKGNFYYRTGILYSVSIYPFNCVHSLHNSGIDNAYYVFSPYFSHTAELLSSQRVLYLPFVNLWHALCAVIQY